MDDDYEDPPVADGLISFLKGHLQRYRSEGRKVEAEQLEKYIEWVDQVREVVPDVDVEPTEYPEETDRYLEEEPQPPEQFPGGDEFMKDEEDDDG